MFINYAWYSDDAYDLGNLLDINEWNLRKRKQSGLYLKIEKKNKNENV